MNYVDKFYENLRYFNKILENKKVGTQMTPREFGEKLLKKKNRRHTDDGRKK